jgi:hypothetical protein
MKLKEVQPVMRRCLRLQAKEDSKKEENPKKGPKEYGTVHTDIENI